MSKQDIIETLKQFLNPFGYDVNNKIEKQKQTIQICKLILILTEIYFLLLLHLFQMEIYFI